MKCLESFLFFWKGENMKNLLYPELIGEMAKHGDTQKTIAKMLGISHLTVCRKFAGKSEWTL